VLFNTVVFLVFLPIVIGIFHLLKQQLHKKIFLIIASYVFYGYWDWRFLFLILLSTVVDYVIAIKLDEHDSDKVRKGLLLASIVINLGILGVFKYFNFFTESFQALSNNFGYELDMVHLNIILPVGISFYTFQTMSYTMDVYKHKIKAEHSFVNLALYVSFFPQLVAGPIEKAAHLLPQIQTLIRPTLLHFKEGFILITMGMMKKVLIGDTCGLYVDHIFSEPSQYQSFELLSALLLFAVQIYADFAGYTSIGRGVAKMLGIDLVHNFKQPYLSANITEFWRRWHMSLSSWLKEYLYIWGLGGNRKGKIRTYVNLMLTMLIGGLWHGSSWNFVVWGGIHGLGLAGHKLLLGDKKAQSSFTYSGMGSLMMYLFKALGTFIIVLIAWLFFRVTDFGQTLDIINEMLALNWTYESGVLLQIVAVYYFVMISIDVLEYRTGTDTFLLILKTERWIGICLALWITIIVYMLSVSKPLPFIYFQF